VQWATDKQFRCPTITQQTWHSAAGNPAYQFEFVRVPSGRDALGATHGSEVAYVFGNLDRGIFRGTQVRANAVDAQVSDAIQQYWTNFAKTGDPNGAGLPVWSKFDPTKRAYIQFTDAGPIPKEGLRRPYCDLFMQNVKRQMTR
jgi:para-nitrobenzyl esterase